MSVSPNITTSLQHLDDVMNHCIHCGMCLPVCPTYNITFNERSSPRGRIRLIRSVYDGSLEVSKEFADEMNFCLDCQACQTACPAGVHYGELVENARQLVAERQLDPFPLRFIKGIFLRGILASPKRTKYFGMLLRLYERSGLREAFSRSGLLQHFAPKIHRKHELLPHPSPTTFSESAAEFLPSKGKRRGRVGFLTGCIMDIAFADVHRDTIEVLRENGFEVVIPRGQVCCGSLHGHNGDMIMAHSLARENVTAFAKYELDAIVINSAGCSAFMKEYGRTLADDPVIAAQARALASKVKDVAEFLVEVGYRVPRAEYRARVSYHEACHLVHTQKISRQPRTLIQAIPGIEFVELPEATWCCGSAGIYNIIRFDDSMKFLDRKMNNVDKTEADILVTANPGCHLQLQHGIQSRGLKMEVLHPISLLRRAYAAEKSTVTEPS